MRIEIGPLVVETTETNVFVTLRVPPPIKTDRDGAVSQTSMLTWEQWCGLANLVDTQMPEKIDEGDEWKRPR